MNELVLTGCRPEPLLAYLKALGVWRLVVEQKLDPNARGGWRNDDFVLFTALDHDALVSFFYERYRPTPLVVPWSGSDFFGGAAKFNGQKVSKEPEGWAKEIRAGRLHFKETPTSSQVIGAILATDSNRLTAYRQAIEKVQEIKEKIGLQRIKKKSASGQDTAELKIPGKNAKESKARFLSALRSWLPDDLVIWLDVAVAIEKDGPSFNMLLGSGGGSDGNAHFSDNFMQNLWDCLPEFDTQREGKALKARISQSVLRNSLFGEPCQDLILNRTSSLYDAGAVGGPNATQGMERDPITNPWNFILALEGALCLAGAISRRQGANRAEKASFPFVVKSRAVGNGSLSAKDDNQHEIWLPLWERPLSLAEVELVFAEGRAETSTRRARDGLEFARAVAGFGVDTGIQAFARFAIVKGRVGGDKYNSATLLGRFVVSPQPAVDCLSEIDDWLDSFRRACSDKTAPARFDVALRRLDSAIFDYCRYGGARFGEILCALGGCERELARVGDKPGKIGDGKFPVKPVPLLSPQWLAAAEDGSAEYRLALALASINDKEIGPLRANLEPVDVKGKWPQWANKGGAVVWSAADVCRNLAAVLERRMIDASKTGAEGVPLTARRSASWDDIAALLSDQIDERRLEEWLWGAILLNWREMKDAPDSHRTESESSLPRAYALLKLLFLPFRQALQTERGDAARPEPSILPLLRAGQLNRACEVALRRLRASGYMALPGPVAGQRRRVDFVTEEVDTMRLAAALLIPIPNTYTLQEIVLRPRPNIISL